MAPPIPTPDNTGGAPGGDAGDVTTQVQNLGGLLSSITDKLGVFESIKTILGEYGPVLGAVVLGFKALTTVLKPLSWAFEKLGSIVSGTFEFFKNTAVGILQTAYKAYHGLYNITNVAMKQFAKFGFDVREQNKQVLEAGEQTKEMFDSMSTTGEAINKTLGSAIGMITSMSATTSKFARIFGLGAAGAAKMISETANQVGNMGNLSEIFGQQVFESANSIMTFTLATKGLGASADDIRAMSVISKSELQSFEMTLADITTAIRDVSIESGTNKKVLSKNFLALRKDFVDFGYIGDRELANVASRAIHLGLEISELSNMFKKVSTFEDATNMASQLSQAFGMNIDALEMLRAENPMDMIDMLRDSMLATGKTFDDMNRFERQLITQYTGLTGETAKLIFNYKDLGKSNAEIKKIMADNKPENQQLKALKEIETSVTKLIHIMDKDNPLGAFFEGLTTNIKRAIPGIQNISRTLESFYNMGLNIKPQTIKKLAAPFAGFIKDIDGSLKRLKSKIPEATKELGNFFENINDDWTSSAGSAYNKANKHLQSFLDLSGSASSAFVTDFQRTALKMVGMGAKVAMTVIPTMMRITRNILKGIKKLFTGGIGSSVDKADFDLFLRNNLGISLENFEAFFEDVKGIWKGENGQEGLGDIFIGALKAVGSKLFEIMAPPITMLALHLLEEIKKSIIATSPGLANLLGLSGGSVTAAVTNNTGLTRTLEKQYESGQSGLVDTSGMLSYNREKQEEGQLYTETMNSRFSGLGMNINDAAKKSRKSMEENVLSKSEREDLNSFFSSGINQALGTNLGAMKKVIGATISSYSSLINRNKNIDGVQKKAIIDGYASLAKEAAKIPDAQFTKGNYEVIMQSLSRMHEGFMMTDAASHSGMISGLLGQASSDIGAVKIGQGGDIRDINKGYNEVYSYAGKGVKFRDVNIAKSNEQTQAFDKSVAANIANAFQNMKMSGEIKVSDSGALVIHVAQQMQDPALATRSANPQGNAVGATSLASQTPT